MERGFGNPMGSKIPDSLSCIPDSKAQDFRFHKNKMSRHPESGFPYNFMRQYDIRQVFQSSNFTCLLIGFYFIVTLDL